jgi:gluconokinase
MRPLDPRAILIVVGVLGSGKTTIATTLAQRLGWPLEEGDELHPPAFAKIHSGHPLYAREQWAWLEKVAAWIDGCRQLGTGGVIACSALKRSYRDFLTRGRPQVRVVYLHGERPLIEERLAAREKNSTLPDILDHHFAILEEPDADENPFVVDVSRPMEDILAEILRELAPPVPDDRDAVVARDSSDRQLFATSSRARRDHIQRRRAGLR